MLPSIVIRKFHQLVFCAYHYTKQLKKKKKKGSLSFLFQNSSQISFFFSFNMSFYDLIELVKLQLVKDSKREEEC